MNRAVIYARFSSSKQREESIEGQLRYCEKYAANMGYTVVRHYIDRALSGTSDRRPQFQQMIEDSKKKQFDYVIVWKLDRFSRNRYDSAIYKNKLKKNGVKVISATEGIGEGDESIILEAVLEAMAETYSKQLAQNVKRGLNESALKCTSTGGNIPYGYKLECKGGKLVPDEETAPIAKYIFEQYAAGVSKSAIARELNAKGIRTRSGTPFKVGSFQSMFENTKYIGVFHWNDVEIEDGCPAIIDRELFEKCRTQAKLNKRNSGANKAKTDYQLRGKLFCGHCGAPMVGDSGRSKTGVVHYYYACAERKKRTAACTKKREKKDFIEWYVVEQALEYVLAPSRLEHIAERVVKEYDRINSDYSITDIEREIEKANAEFERLTDSLINASSPRMVDAINQKAEQLDARLAELEEQRAEMLIYKPAAITVEDVERWLKSFCNGDPTDEAFRRKIIDTLINAVYLYDDKVVIYFNVKDGQQISYIEMLEDIEGESSNIESVSSPKTLIFEHIGLSIVFGMLIKREQ